MPAAVLLREEIEMSNRESNAGDSRDIYTELAERWCGSTYMWLDYVPENGALQNVLREIFSAEEAEALKAVPVRPVPLDYVPLHEIAAASALPPKQLETILDGIVERGLIFAGKVAGGEKGYALIKNGYGFSQVFYWKGQKNELTHRLAELEGDHAYRKARMSLYVSDAHKTKAWRYIPLSASVDPQWQNVYPTETIERVIQKADKFALVHCTCRVIYEIKKGESCGHSTDVCIKMDELAESVIRGGLGREISREEALAAIRKAATQGLVHFTDNTEEGIKHICNCCGCACWNVGAIRRRLVPRDMLMATYFIRETPAGECCGCAGCVDICPVNAVTVENGRAKVDPDWCIGCGVCMPCCPTGAIKISEKSKQPIRTKNLKELYTRLNSEREQRLDFKTISSYM
ncbi:MAG: 4Fe-4S binding protein [Bacillota bacterium]